MAVVLLGDGQFRSADPTMEDYDTPDDFAEEIDTALNFLFLLRLETHDHGVVVTRQSCFISLKWTLQ